MKLNKITKKLSRALNHAQKNCTAVYYNRFTKSWEPVIDVREFTFVTISIGHLLGMHTDYYAIGNDKPEIIYFPDGKSMIEMMQNPLEFDKWWKENIDILNK